MKKTVLGIVIISLLVVMILVFWSSALKKYLSMPLPQPQVYLLNVLDKKEFDDAHIPGSLHLSPAIKLSSFVEKWDRIKPVVTYCSNYYCTASMHIAKKLKELGFSNVYAYEAGIAEWYQMAQKDPKKYPVVGPAKSAYLNIKVPHPDKKEHEIPIITTEKLQKMLEDANMLNVR